MKALSSRQPYAHNIVHDGKDVENRNWRTHFRGRVLIHASLSKAELDRDEYGKYQFGGIIGHAEIVDCVDQMDSRWFYGPWGFLSCSQLASPSALPWERYENEEAETMTDLVGTCPKDFWLEWVTEGDAAGDTPTSEEWGWFTRHHLIGAIHPGDRFYVVAHGMLRGYAPVTRVTQSAIGRRGGAVSVTIDEPVPGFRGLRERWWDREIERPFPDWKTANVHGMGSMDDEALRAAFDQRAPGPGQSKFTRRMAILMADATGMKPMFLVWRLETMGLIRPGGWAWLRRNGAITRHHVEKVRADAAALV